MYTERRIVAVTTQWHSSTLTRRHDSVGYETKEVVIHQQSVFPTKKWTSARTYLSPDESIPRAMSNTIKRKYKEQKEKRLRNATQSYILGNTVFRQKVEKQLLREFNSPNSNSNINKTLIWWQKAGILRKAKKFDEATIITANFVEAS